MTMTPGSHAAPLPTGRAGPSASIRDSARTTTWVLFLIGSVLLVFGGLIMASSWPTGEVTASPTGGTGIDTGSPGGLLGGLVLCAFSQAVMLIALISFGVRLGTESVRSAE